MDCVYRNQNTGWCGQTTGPQGGCYPSGMTGYPLAMAYIPWQQWKTPYDPAKGLSRGTILKIWIFHLRKRGVGAYESELQPAFRLYHPGQLCSG